MNFKDLTKTEQFDVIYDLAKDVVANYTPQKMDDLYILGAMANYNVGTILDVLEGEI